MAQSYEPKGNSEALDLFQDAIGGITDTSLRLLFAARDVAPAYRWARLGALQRMLELGFAAPKVAVYNAGHDAEVLRKETAWLDSWEDRKKIDMVLAALSAEFAALRVARPKVLRRETLLPNRVLARLQSKKGKG